MAHRIDLVGFCGFSDSVRGRKIARLKNIALRGANNFLLRKALDDPAAADYLILLIEDGGLAGGDGSLGLVEVCPDGVVVDA